MGKYTFTQEHHYTGEPTDYFTIELLDNNHLKIIKNENEKIIFIENNRIFCYKLLKTKIKACDGAIGLYNFIKKCIECDFMTCDAFKILNYAIETMKACN